METSGRSRTGEARVNALEELEASAQAMAEVSAQTERLGRWLGDTATPAEDLWMAILAAQGKLEEAKECFLDLNEMAWELVIAEQQRTKDKSE